MRAILSCPDRPKARAISRFPAGASLEAKVRELAVIQDEQGYLSSATVDDDGTIRLRQCNCAIFGVAAQSTSPCAAELDLFREVLGADVIRETHIASGDRSCTYRIVDTGGSLGTLAARASALDETRAPPSRQG